MEVKRLNDIAEDLVKGILLRKPHPDLPSSLNGINKITWGYHKGEVTIIGGRTSTGKTSLALQEAFRLAGQKKIVVFCSMEHSKASIVERIICNEYSLNSEELRNASAIDKVKEKQAFIIKDLTSIPLLIQDDVGREIDPLIQFLDRLKPQPDIVFLDHLQQISTRKFGGNLTTAIQEYIHRVKELAIEKKYAIVVVSQLSRNVSDGGNGDDIGRSRPSLRDLKWSGAIEEVADTVMLLWYPDTDYGFSLLVDKQRNGPLGHTKLKFFPKNFRFEDINLQTSVRSKGERYVDGRDND